MTKTIKYQSEKDNNSAINQLSEYSCSDTSEEYTKVDNRERNTTMKKKTTDNNRNSERHSFS